MAFQLEGHTSYCGKKLVVTADNLEQLHQLLAGIDELNRDARHLHEQSGETDFALDYRQDGDGNDYYGVSVKGSRESVTFGRKREGGLVPFFPKGEEGYYNPDQGRGSRGHQQQRGGGGQQQNGQRGGGSQQQRSTQQRGQQGRGGERQQGRNSQGGQQQQAPRQQQGDGAADDGLPF